ncbi:MAG: nuclear transport factor 2 family protein [Chloroflexota bacterium]
METTMTSSTAATDADRQRVIERYFIALGAKEWDELVGSLAEDSVTEWPQSGEVIRGRDGCLNVYRNYPGGSPALTLRRLTGTGDLWIAEADISYGDHPMQTVSIFEFRDGLISRQVDYFAEPFEPPAWRSQWVESPDKG